MERENLDALRAIAQRKSYRGKYRADPVPREDLRLIMEAGLAAPSGCNMQTTDLIAVDDPALLAQIKEIVPHMPIKTAPALICVLTRKIAAYRDKSYYMQDYSAAIENMLVAVTAMGYASCWYEGDITDEESLSRRAADILSVPPEYALVCMLPVGIPAAGVKGPKKRAFHQRAWFNGFQQE